MLGQVAKNTAAQLAALLATLADRFLVVAILLRVWGPDIYGAWVAILSMASLFTLADCGLNICYGNAMQRAWARNDREAFQRVVSIAMTISGGLTLAFGATTALLIAFGVGPRFDTLSHFAPGDAALCFGLLTIGMLCSAARGSVTQIWRGGQQFALGSLVWIAPTLLTAGLVAVAGTMGAGPVVISAAYLGSELIAGWIFGLWILKRRFPDLQFVPRFPTRSEVADIAARARWYAVLQGTPTVWLQMPILLLTHYGATGVHLVSLIALRTLTNFGRTLGTMLSIGSGVEIASLHHSGRNEDVQRHLMTMGAALSLFTTVTAVAILAFGSPFVALWTGRGDLFDLPIVASLLAAILVAGPTAPLVAHAMLADGSRSLALAQIAQLIIGFMACLLLIPTLGARGAAFALAGAEIIGTGLLLPWLLGRSLNGLSYLAYASSCARTTLAAGVWSLATAALATRLVAPHGVFGLLASGAVWALIGPLPLLLYAAGSERRSRVYARVRLGLGSALSSRAKPETVAGAAAVGRDGRP